MVKMALDEISRPFLKKLDYEKIDLDESSEGTNDDVIERSTRKNSLRKFIGHANIIMLFIISLSCLAVSALLYSRAATLYARSSDLQSRIAYTPIITAKIPFRETQFISAPLSSYNASIYRQPPSPVVDAAWDRLSDIGTHLISSSSVLALGKDLSKAVKLPSSWGDGDDAHIATLDGIHLVHCLNAMRKSLQPNFAYYHPTPLGPEYLPHLTHCVEAVLQHLMCRPSLELLTQNWIERQDAPFPDFAVNKKCWDYEALLEWKDENRVREVERRFGELVPPVGMMREKLPPLVQETWDIIEKGA